MWMVMKFLMFSFNLVQLKNLYFYMMMVVVFWSVFLMSYVGGFTAMKVENYLFKLNFDNLLFILLTILMLWFLMECLNNWYYQVWFFCLFLFMIFFFLSNKMILLYVFFELSMVPMFIMILNWGNNPERLKAATYLIVYTLLGSLPLLLGISCFFMFRLFGIYFHKGFCLFMQSGLMSNEMFSWFCHVFESKILWLCLVLGFMMKLPMFGFHLWLPKAHVEATTEGSMVLASVLLKLGVYGLLRMSWFLLMKSSTTLLLLLSWVGVGVFCVSLICFRNIDLKVFMAYSSVVHMMMILLVCFYSTMISHVSCVLMAVGHGVCSSLLFFFVGSFYNKSSTRNMLLNGGLFNIVPLMCVLWLVVLVMNSNVPPTIKFFGEVLLFLSVFHYFSWESWIIIWTVFLGGMFNMYLFMVTSHGKMKNSLKMLKKYSSLVMFIFVIHMVMNLLMISWWSLF